MARKHRAKGGYAHPGVAENLYDILGVKKDASDDAIRRAYRKLARRHHPDVNPGDAAAEEAFKKMAAAYDVLSDPKKRAAYDEFGESSLAGGFDPERARAYTSWKQARSDGARPFSEAPYEFDLGDLFGRARGPMRGADLRAEVELELRQAIDGLELGLEIPGQGQLRVRIPPGADEGSTIRLKGKGGPGARGGPAGDLLIETHLRLHPHVRRQGLDLHMKLPASLDEAYNGASIEIPTFDGGVKLRIPPLSQNGTRLRLRSRGVKRDDQRGDLLVELDVRIPDRKDDALAAALRAGADATAYSTPLRPEIVL